MPRKSDGEEVKPPKPKEQFRIVLHVYDDGFVDKDLFEFYTVEETGRRKKTMYDSGKEFNDAIKKSLAEDTNKLACWVLEAMGINPNSFAKYVGGNKQVSFNKEEPEDYEESDEDFLDPVEGIK